MRNVELFNKLDDFLDKINPREPKLKRPCCNNVDIKLSPNLLLYCCFSCGVVYKDHLYHKDFYDRWKTPNCVKTFIPYSKKGRHLHRLNKWTNYSYKEVNMDNLLKSIDNKFKNNVIIIYDREIVMFCKVLFKQLYPNLQIRAKIKDALIVYCYYSMSLSLNKDIEIDDLFKLFKISVKNYNDLNNKLKGNKLFYYEKLNEYLYILGLYDNKNKVINMYNLFLSHSKKRFMKKSIILGILYNMVNDKKVKKKFYKTFDISKSSIKNILMYLDEYNIK